MIRHGEALSEQLQTALNGRVIIEQTKGTLAERGRVDMDTAFAQLRGYALDHNLRVVEVARGVVDGSVDATRILHAMPTS